MKPCILDGIHMPVGLNLYGFYFPILNGSCLAVEVDTNLYDRETAEGEA